MTSLQSFQKIANLHGLVARTVYASTSQSKKFSTSSPAAANKSYKVVIVGGGAGGCSIGAKFASKLGKDKIAIIEPSDTHYYQPWWTLQGGGYKKVGSGRPMGSVLPQDATWIQDRVVSFDPDNNKVMTMNGDEISYDYLVVAMGLQLFYDRIKGLPEALETPGVGSNYHSQHVTKTWKAIQDFKEGNAVFTFPNTPVKCAGAPQKIMYIAEARFREMGKRDKASIEYHTSLPVLFGVKKYADALWKVVEERNINVSLRSNLVEVRPDSREAVFENLDNPEEEKKVVKYGMLHVTPPMGAPLLLKEATKLTNEAGFLTVNKETLQHVKYPNIFGIGDCTDVPTAKTAAAVAAELPIVKKNLQAAMDGKPLPKQYDGYTSCPLVLGDGKAILAEFDFQAPPQPLETFPWNQAKPLRTSFAMKAYIMPYVYWLMTKGYWEGPSHFRKLLHLGLSR